MNEEQYVQTVRLEPVRKQVRVSLPVEKAFQLFTTGMGTWWPLLTHSVGERQAETCFFEEHVGGRIVEVLKDGTQSEWGKVLLWKPFHKISFHWYPGRAPDTAQEVAVTFNEIPGGTLVELVHIGWETLGSEAPARRDGYETGWDYVLAKYIIAAANS
ncbi:MAG TPA: SRPBCC domain-containing protein [Anaerolineales bacterium]|nr:SRPBCC domain-containing protein [Anaerolineales bacterium]